MFELTKDTLKKSLEILKINDIITPEEIDGFLVKKMALSNILKKNRPTGDTGKQTHIAITSKERSLFPMVSNVTYYDKSENIKFYDLKLPATLIKSNLEPLDKRKLIKFEGKFKETFTICYIRKDGENFQVQLSKLKNDDKTFIDFRGLILEEDYLCIIKKKNEFKFYFLILKKDKKDIFFKEFNSDENLIYLDNTALTEVSKKDILEADDTNENYKSLKKLNKPHNRIIYGAPGTGKSYQLNEETNGVFKKNIIIEKNNLELMENGLNVSYWLVTCGKDNVYWDGFQKNGIFAVGWDQLGNLKQDTTEEMMLKRLKMIKSGNYEIKNQWRISHLMKKGDIVGVRKGIKDKQIVGYGIVTGDYNFDESRDFFKQTIPVEWRLIKDIKLDKYSKQFPMQSIVEMNNELKIIFKRDYLKEEIQTEIEEIEISTVDRVTFYDGYTHGQFVGTYKPVPKGDTITYEYIPGPFMKQLVESYKNPNYNFCLIIEEINRAKADKVFGNIFQLLDRDSSGKSEYHIAVSEDQEVYLREELEDEYDEILKDLLDKGLYIPKNLYIWATMNSADQGVYPMDSAFKRRWHFKHIGLDENEDEFGDEEKTYVLRYQKNLEDEEIEDKIILWNDFRKIINKVLSNENVSEDRLLAPFFIRENNFQVKEDNIYELDIEVFKNKILMYLFDDVLRHKKKTILFDDSIINFSQLIEACDDGKVIFKSGVIQELDEKRISKED